MSENRAERLRRIKREIESGTYVTGAKLRRAVEKMIHREAGRSPRDQN